MRKTLALGTLVVGISVFIMAVAIIVPSAAQADIPTPAVKDKPPVPDAAACKAATALVNDVYKDDLAAARTPEQKAALAGKLLAAAKDEKDAGRYALLAKARDLAIDAGDLDGGNAALDGIEAAFALDAVKSGADAYWVLAPHLSASGRTALCQNVSAAVQAALAVDQLDIAKSDADLDLRLARFAKDDALIARATADVQTVYEIATAGVDAQKAMVVLVDKPSDADANLKVGKYRCFIKGDWKTGLPMLLLGSDATLKALAEKESAGVSTPDDQVKLGDGWWDVAATLARIAKANVQAHAAQSYNQAMPQLSGLAKTRVEKRVMGIGAVTNIAAAVRLLTLDLGNGVTLKLARIPAGKFLMGSPKTEKDHQDNEIQHEVTISKPFYMGVTHVTVSQYAQCVKITGQKHHEPDFKQTSDDPVVNVSWSDAQTFCKWLSKKTGKMVQLPTQAQWEYACRAGTTTAYNTGADEKTLDEAAWYHDNSEQRTHPVGLKKPNAWGLYDMVGNVWQWCSDAYDNYPVGDVTDPQAMTPGARPAVRGGCFLDGPATFRAALRHWNDQGSRYVQLGFRVVAAD